MNKNSKIVILICYAIWTGIAIYGTLNLKTWYSIDQTINDQQKFKSYEFLETRNEFFSEEGFETVIYV